MKKSIVALGCALTCLGAAHAQSSVQVTGLVDAYVGSMRLAGADKSTSVVGSGGMTTSWFGFTGTEDLGGGLKANFKLTSFFQADKGTPTREIPGDTFFSRDANVGLSGGFGAVQLGRGMAPNFLPTILLNPFGDSFTVSPLVLHANVPNVGAGWFNQTTPVDTGWNNQIVYSTPDIGGLKANLHYQFGEQAGKTGKNNVGLNAMYFNGPLAVMGFYESAQISYSTGGVMDKKTDWMLGGSYDFRVVKAYATYGQAKTDNNSNMDRKTFSLGADVPVSSAGVIKAAIARTKMDNLDLRRTTTSIGYDHNLSKRTDLYAVYMRDQITALNSGNSFVLGIRHRF
ncbi:MAG: porin [Acidovorax sp.]